MGDRIGQLATPCGRLVHMISVGDMSRVVQRGFTPKGLQSYERS